MIYGLLLAMAVCGKNQVLGATPEGSDTIFMRFEKYTRMSIPIGNNGTYIDGCVIKIVLTHDKYDGEWKETTGAGHGVYLYSVPVMMEIETDRGKSIKKTDISWVKNGVNDALQRIPISFGDSLRGRDFTVKLYGCEPDGEYLGFRMVESIEVSDTTLVELKFQNCLSLQSVSCGAGRFKNKIKSLELKGCPNLSRLNCNENQLTSLDVSGCPNLSKLRCEGNQLTSLDVSGCSNLVELDCSSNQLTLLDVSGCISLGDIDEIAFDCSNNQLTSLNVNDCIALWGLDCSNNQLTSLDVSGCPKLRVLRCGFNQLTSLELWMYHELSSLSCRNNQLAALDLYDISHMGSCNISGNRLSEVLYTGKGMMYWLGFGDNCLPLHKCLELSKLWGGDREFLQGNSQHIPVSLDINERYDLHVDMELDDARTTLRVTRKGGGYLNPELYRVEDDWLSFAEKGEYTVEMTNPKIREYITGDYGILLSTALVSVFLDVRVGMPAETTPDNPSDPTDPDTPDNPTTANEALETLTAALQVYPNPASDVLHVELLPSAASESLRAVRILSQNGHLCHSFGSGFDNLPVADLPAGLYFIEAETTTGTVLRQKFVKR